MTPSHMDQIDATEGAELAFEQSLLGAGDFGEGHVASLADSLQTEGSEPAAEAETTAGFGENSAMIMGLPVMLKVVLGSAKMPVATLAKLAKGSVVKLDKAVGDPVDILVNGRLIARGEVVVLNEGTSRFGVVLTQVGSLTNVTK